MRRLILFASFLAALALVAGCATVNSGAGKRSLYVDSHPELDAAHARAILDGQIMVGMTQEMIQASWGKPSRTESVPSENLEDPTSRWVYGNVFVGGTVTDLFFDQDGRLVRYEVNAHQGAGSGGRIMTAEQTEKSTGSNTDPIQNKEGGSRP